MRHLLLSTVLFCSATLAQAQDAALLIGIEDYDTLSDVDGAADIRDGAGLLERQGFDVFGTGFGIGAAGTLQGQANRFAAAAEEAERLVIVLAGQFVTDGSRTWLMPDDAEDPAPFSVANGAVLVETALDQLGRTPGAAVLVLGRDSRADDDFGNGLKFGIGPLDIPSGVTVVQGSVAAASDLLTRVIAAPGGDIIAGVRGSRNLTGSGFMPQDLVLIPAAAQTAAPAPAPAPTPAADTGSESAAWDQAQATNTETAYSRYLDRYPQGAHASDAVARLTELRNPSLAFKRTEDALNLPLDARRAIQRDLQVLGLDTRGIDGIFGPGTRSAIEAWQGQNGADQTGYLDREQITRIDTQAATKSRQLEAEAAARREAEQRADRAYWDRTGVSGAEADLRAYLDRYPDGLFAGQARAGLADIQDRTRANAAEADRAAWDRVTTANTTAGYRTYLANYPDGAFRAEAAARLERLQQGNDNQAATDAAIAAERALALDPISLRLVESRLAQLGLEPGNVDGTLDQDTRGAIRRYQRDRQLTVSGYLDQATVSQMLTDAFQ